MAAKNFGDGELVAARNASLDVTADRLVGQARAEGIALTGEGGLLTGLIQRVLQGALEVEMTDHLGYEPHDRVGHGAGNSRNGHYPKWYGLRLVISHSLSRVTGTVRLSRSRCRLVNDL